MKEFNRLQRQAKSVKQVQRGGGSLPKNSSDEILKPKDYEIVRINKRERQEDLRKVLVDTVKLNKKLKEQLAIMERNGINVSYSLPQKASNNHIKIIS